MKLTIKELDQILSLRSTEGKAQKAELEYNLRQVIEKLKTADANAEKAIGDLRKANIRIAGLETERIGYLEQSEKLMNAGLELDVTHGRLHEAQERIAELETERKEYLDCTSKLNAAKLCIGVLERERIASEAQITELETQSSQLVARIAELEVERIIQHPLDPEMADLGALLHVLPVGSGIANHGDMWSASFCDRKTPSGHGETAKSALLNFYEAKGA